MIDGTRVLAVALNFLVLILIDPQAALADKCDVDCNKKCCKTVRITPWDKNTFCEPTCKSTCEATKAICKDAGVKLPHAPNLIAEVEKQLNFSCAAAFQIINQAVVVYQGPYAAGSSRMLDEAKGILVALGLVGAQEFNNVSIRWARLLGRGQAPDRNVVLISEEFLKSNDLKNTTATLLHEMVHVRQYRRMGTDRFKCDYSRAFVGTGGDIEDRNFLEREAYAIERQHAPLIGQYIAGNRLGTAQLCVTPAGTCQYSQPVPGNIPCQCQFPNGIVWGKTR